MFSPISDLYTFFTKDFNTRKMWFKFSAAFLLWIPKTVWIAPSFPKAHFQGHHHSNFLVQSAHFFFFFCLKLNTHTIVHFMIQIGWSNFFSNMVNLGSPYRSQLGMRSPGHPLPVTPLLRVTHPFWHVGLGFCFRMVEHVEPDLYEHWTSITYICM